MESLDREENRQYRINFNEYYQSVINYNNNNSKEINITTIIFNLSFDIFKQCVEAIDKILSKNDNNEDNQNKNLVKLYSISYIKIYLSKLVYFIYEKSQILRDIKEITSFIIGTARKNNFRKVLKIYIFKLFFNLMDRDWDKVTNYNFSHYGIEFTDILTEENKEIINEKTIPNKTNEDYPLLKYFFYTKYKTREDFMKGLKSIKNYINEFPLLFKYLEEDKKESNLKKLQYLPNFNEFSNYMIDYYSFKISREDAKTRVLNSEPIFRENGFDRKFDNFKKSWKSIKKKATKYKFHHEMEEKTFENNEKLIYFLTDDKEVGFGMYFSAAYENFISWQNDFLNYIIENGANKSNLNIYIENIKNEIPIYEANTNQIVLINSCFLNSINFNSFDDLINTLSYRNIFNEDRTINYLNYNDFKYDFSSIEEELAKLLLTGKCLFEKDNLKLVIYLGEFFNNGKSDILENFYKKYKQTDLNENEKKLILRYMKKHENNINNNQFFASLQLLIFYLGNNNLKEKETISNIIKEAPEYLNIENIRSEFFEKEGKNLTADKIMSIFFFIEHLCFKDLNNNIPDDYKKDINDDIISKIKDKLLNNKLNDKFTIKELGAAVRRFISRYLVGKKENVDINENTPLINLLKRPELWEEKIASLNNLDELISAQLEEFKLTVGQSLKLYEAINEEDEKEINYQEEDEDDEEEKEKEEDILVRKNVRRRVN